MKSERWRQIDEVFQAALERGPEERAAFIGEACGDDDSLRLEVEKLLAADGEAGSLIETPAYAVAAPMIVGDDAPTLLGKTISHYQIIAPLGKGGMGEVYRARDIRLDRTVALKILPAEIAADKDRMPRFVREAKAASALNHPNVAHIYEIGEENGLSFIAMEYVEGQTLAAKINGQPLTVNEIVEIASQIADALDEAHGKGITHRDIKPANVMLNERGQVKVLDFGLAKVARPAEQPVGSDISTMAKTAPGVVMGTVPYMSPEQALGQAVDHRSDIFSLGVVLYEMATGRLPFTGANTSETLDRILHSQPDAMARFNYDVPAELERIVRKCLEKERERRYQSARELLVDLKNLKRDSDAMIRSTAKAVGLLSRVKRHKTGLAIALVSLTALILLTIFVPSWIRNLFQPAKSAFHPLKRLTFDSGFQFDPTWSPKDDFIAYSSDRGGNFDIWVQPISGGDPVQVTHSLAQDWQPDWSPNGTQIVFRSEREGGGLFVVPAFGGRERKISSFGVNPQWSPDGQKILFHDGSGRVYQKLYMVTLDGQPPHEILSESTADFINFYSRPFWHPDGQRISVIGGKKSGESGLWIVQLAGGPAIKSEPTPEVERLFQENHLSVEFAEAHWAPSGSEMYFTTSSSRSGNSVRFFGKVTVDPQSLRWIAGPEQLTTDLSIDDYWALSRDGKRLAYMIGSETLRICSFPFDSGVGKVKGQGQPITSNGMDPGFLNLSPDGKKLAFMANRQGYQKQELWEKSLDNGKEILLVSGILSLPICWARDSTRIAYLGIHPITETPKRENFSILIQPSGGGDEQVIASGALDWIWDWTSDGNWILASTDRASPVKPRQLCLYPLAAAPHAEAQMRVITSSPEYEFYQARISPNDRWICFVGGKAGDPASIYVVSASGGEWTRVSDGKTWDDKPRWAPDGKTLYFISKSDQFYNVFGIRFDPANGKPLGTPFQVTNFNSFSQMISPNLAAQELGLTANRLVLPISEITGSIWILENVDR